MIPADSPWVLKLTDPDFRETCVRQSMSRDLKVAGGGASALYAAVGLAIGVAPFSFGGWLLSIPLQSNVILARCGCFHDRSPGELGTTILSLR